MSSQRRFHTDSRVSENFTERGLSELTGQDPRKWDRYILKELVDNSLEAVEEDNQNPAIGVQIEGVEKYSSWRPKKIVVKDNGPGIGKARVKRIFENVGEFGGTKRHYNLPTRGNIGNALMTILGIHGFLGNPLIVKSRGKIHKISVEKDTISGVPEIERGTKTANIDGTEIIADLDGADFGKGRRMEKTLSSFVALNPHVSFDISINVEGAEKREVLKAVNEPTGQKFNLSKRTTTGKPNWFSYSGFKERLKADARAEPDLPLDDFVKEFAKVSSRLKRKSILGSEFKDMTVYGLADSDDESIRKLYRRMVDHTEPYSGDNLHSTLGSIGKDLKVGLLRFLDFTEERGDVEELAEELASVDSADDLITYYGDGDVVTDEEKDMPFYFELAAVPKSSKGAKSEVVFGINQSVSYSNPPIRAYVEHTSGEKYHPSISSAFNETGHGYFVVANLTCPNITYLDRGKQKFEIEPLKPCITGVVGKAVRKIERDLRPVLNRHWKDEEETVKRELAHKAQKGFIKDFVFGNFRKAYNEGTDGGRLTITMRQLYYIMNPWFKELKEQYGYKWTYDSSPGDKDPLKLDYGTFSDYVSDYEVKRLGKRLIHRSKRGFFVEPHSNKKVDLETSSIKNYSPDLEQFNNLLFVEKTGFFKQIHQDFKLTKKYDIGLINAKGFNVIAGKDLIEKIQKETDCTLYILSDLDVHGIGIAEKTGEPDALSEFTERFDTERLGLRLQDVEEYDLPIEKKEYSDKEITRIENMVERGEMSKELADFFEKDQRVEVNALRPEELEQYLIDRLEEEGVEKVKPEEEDIDEPDIKDPEDAKEEAIEKAVGSFVMDEAGSEIINVIKDEGVDYGEDAEEKLEDLAAENRGEIHQEVLDELEDKPPKLWKEIMRELVKEREDEGGEAEEKFGQEVVDSVVEWCKENVSVEMKLKKN